MVIIDSAVHIWRAPTPERPWMPGRTAHLPDPIGYEDLRKRMAEAGVDRAVLIPPSWEGDRVDYSVEAASKYPDKFAIMGRIPLQGPKERSSSKCGRSSPACWACG
jgi:predicted TIM-barrel fold metal-dependent hydrolase